MGGNPCPRPSHPPRAQSIQALRRQICSSKVPLQDAGGRGAARGRAAMLVPVPGGVLLLRWHFGGGPVLAPGRMPSAQGAAGSHAGDRHVSRSSSPGSGRASGAPEAGGWGDALPAAAASCCLLVNRLLLFVRNRQRPGPLVQPGRGAGSEHCGAHCTPDGASAAGSSSRGAAKPRAALMQSRQPPDTSCPFSAPSSPARGCCVQWRGPHGRAHRDAVSATKRPHPQLAKQFWDSPFLRAMPGTGPASLSRAQRTAPLAPRAGAGVKQAAGAQPSLADGMRPPRFWAVGEPGELGKTEQGLVFWSVSSRLEEARPWRRWREEVPRWHGTAALGLSAAVAPACRGAQRCALRGGAAMGTHRHGSCTRGITAHHRWARGTRIFSGCRHPGR